ncbi:hypothetical protein AVEN_154038-1 [Araneus ventricosus]|uniref:Uncharacterized protein n=1 Tax=Araneus ventricosus TaxID=182803 RepID=A0A4Y2NGU6_ARAVE|nr:hypothetical protein AVEN_154038-1 [Araneus ventricosus]
MWQNQLIAPGTWCIADTFQFRKTSLTGTIAADKIKKFLPAAVLNGSIQGNGKAHQDERKINSRFPAVLRSVIPHSRFGATQDSGATGRLWVTSIFSH